MPAEPMRGSKTLLRNLGRLLVPRRCRNWLRAPGKSLHWLWDEGWFRLGRRQELSLRPGWRIVCHPAAYRCAYYAQVTDPAQTAEFDGFLATCHPGMRLLDVGAHFGVFALAALHYGGRDARVWAVDPSPVACRMMRTQARLNSLTDRWEIVEAMVGDHAGHEPMVAVGVLADGYYATPSASHSAGELTDTRAITIDDLAASSACTFTHVKIDVEGAEAAVLRGARTTLDQPQGPLLFVELHHRIVREQGRDPAETLETLRGYGYRLLDERGTPVDAAALLRADLVRIRAVKDRNAA